MQHRFNQSPSSFNIFAVQGFTLIELMITVVIIGILSAVALPSYKNYVIRGKIPSATSALAAKRLQQEQFFQDNRTYMSGTGCVANSSDTNFNFSCTGVTATTYTLQAVGKASMAGFTYTLNQDNARTTTVTGVTGWTGNTACWVANTGGLC